MASMNTLSNEQDTRILDGKQCSQLVLAELAEAIKKLHPNVEALPKLVVVVVGENPASLVYVRKKVQTAQKLGMLSELIALPEKTTEAELLTILDGLNNEQHVHGILVQLPLPPHISTETVLLKINPQKDVDGFHPINAGKLYTGASAQKSFYPIPCTPAGIMMLLEKNNINVSGLHAVIIGRSNIVGKPISQLLLQANATITICHSKTPNLQQFAASADILVTAVGQPNLVTSSWVKPGAVVVDVGINRLPNGRLCGDVLFEDVLHKAAYITPVPGGVGPMTVAMLMYNTLKCYEFLQGVA